MVRKASSFLRDLDHGKYMRGKERIRKCDECGKRRPVTVNYVCLDCNVKKGRLTVPADYINT